MLNNEMRSRFDIQKVEAEAGFEVRGDRRESRVCRSFVAG